MRCSLTRRLARGALSLSLLGACAPSLPAQRPAPAQVAPRPLASPEQRLESALELLAASRYTEAEADFRAALTGPSAARARLGLLEVLVTTGRADEAQRLAAEAPSAERRAPLLVWQARALRRLGRLSDALALLEGVGAEPEGRQARLLRGEWLLETTAPPGASEELLMSLVLDYNQDRVAPTDADGLAWVGRAAQLLRSPHDANDAFDEAERARPGHVPTLLYRAELFLDKYDPGRAEQVLREVLAKAPHQPDALVALAHVKLAQALDFDAAEALARAALAVDPGHAGAHFVLAGIALRDQELPLAEQRLDAGLALAPRDLDLLSLRAAVRFLADDAAGFERAKAAVLALSPRWTRLYRVISDYADWEHRYDALVQLAEEGLKLDALDAKLRAQLGINLLRAGDDAGGLRALERAFKEDPFNVRVFNTLELYEQSIPRDYVTERSARFTWRFPREDAPVLRRYLPRTLDAAWQRMVQRYGVEPPTPIGVEIYASREAFAVRTSGLPGTSIQGVCFGRTLASVSPRGEPFNLPLTIWHELAHVFHLHATESRVPRWFTEGLAELETELARPEWTRQLDGLLYEALRAQRLPQLASMNHAFTRAEQLEDLAVAYYASSQLVAMLYVRYGDAGVVRLLQRWRDGARGADALPLALGQSPGQLDEDFRRLLARRLERYAQQFVPLARLGPRAALAAAVTLQPKRAEAWARRGLAHLQDGEREPGLAALETALALEPRQRDALYALARARLAEGERAVAGALAQRLLEAGGDGVATRLLLAELADSPARRREHYERARQLDPTSAEPLRRLAQLARQTHDEPGELGALLALTRLEEHDLEAHRRALALLVGARRWDEAVELGARAIEVGVLDGQTHALYAEALLGQGERARAAFELESAVACGGRPGELADLWRRLAMVRRQAGDLDGARRAEREATALGAP